MKPVIVCFMKLLKHFYYSIKFMFTEIKISMIQSKIIINFTFLPLFYFYVLYIIRT